MVRETAAGCARAAQMLLMTRELRKAKGYGIRATELDPQSANAHLVLAQIFREGKEYSQAAKSLEQVMRLDPKHQEAMTLLKEVQKLA
jgi:Tfp pilus assembly protein PilF